MYAYVLTKYYSRKLPHKMIYKTKEEGMWLSRKHTVVSRKPNGLRNVQCVWKNMVRSWRLPSFPKDLITYIHTYKLT